MPTKGYNKIFQTNPELTKELLEVLAKERRDSLVSKYFQNKGISCDRTTIRYYRKKTGIGMELSQSREMLKPKKIPVEKIPAILPPIIIHHKDHYFVNGERYSTGKPYADYLEAEKKRREKEKGV